MIAYRQCAPVKSAAAGAECAGTRGLRMGELILHLRAMHALSNFLNIFIMFLLSTLASFHYSGFTVGDFDS